jgi:single-stranded-DNA-specific exonuclease
VANHERVLIHGDYDVDGITSTVILRRALEILGADVSHFVPDRVKDGYGLQPATIDRLHAMGARIIVSVDCGIRATEAARRAREPIDLIITDHRRGLAARVRGDQSRGLTARTRRSIRGGVARKLVQALLASSGRSATCSRTS